MGVMGDMGDMRGVGKDKRRGNGLESLRELPITPQKYSVIT